MNSDEGRSGRYRLPEEPVSMKKKCLEEPCVGTAKLPVGEDSCRPLWTAERPWVGSQGRVTLRVIRFSQVSQAGSVVTCDVYNLLRP